MAAFDAWLEARGHGAGALFGRAVRGGRVGERRRADEGVAVILRDRASAAGIAPFTPHDMRRTYISELLDAGADLATVQKMVGHESVTTTAGYDRRGDVAKRKAADLVHVPFFPRQARASGWRIDRRQRILPKTSTIRSGYHAGKKARIWLQSKARSFAVRRHGRLQPYCWAA
jgi:hypothetical protein